MAEETTTKAQTQQTPQTQTGKGNPTQNAQTLGQINREFQEKSVIRRAKELNVNYIDIAKTPLNPDFLKIIDIEAAKKARVVPFFTRAKDLYLAIENPELPETQAVLEDIKARGYNTELYLASSTGLDEALNIYSSTQQYKKPTIVENVEERSVKTYEKEIADLKSLGEKLETVTAEEGMNLLNIGALKSGASDVHYEPETSKTVVRFRIDGILHNVLEIKPDVYATLLNQLKYKSKMRLNINNVPQDGRYDFTVNDRQIDVRVSSIPTPYGESIVCRFLDQKPQSVSFEELGFQGYALEKINNAAGISHGMVLVTGPTGSGKTTTLYSVLNRMKTTENKIITLEDPVEYHVAGVTQSQIDEKRGYTFASGLRSVLRQDPDIVMIGEIRDLDTAQTAAQAALTGHVVLSTLHTNSAIESIPRLVNMGLAPFMVAPALDTIIAQRLVRRVCAKCVTMRAISESEKKEFAAVLGADKVPANVPEIHGCDVCSQTGYKGRLVICEVVIVNNDMKALILNNAGVPELLALARKNGMLTMKEDGFMKVTAGLTTLEEVIRETNVAV